MLTALFVGTVGGGVVGAALPGLDVPDVPDLLGLSSTGRQTGRNVTVHGGDDISGARENALRVWAATPSMVKAELRASYQGVGARSTDQIAMIRNLLAQDAIDLVVIDPQYLPELVAKKQLRRFAEVSTDSLGELGCFPGLVRQCTVDGPLYAVPVNADAPMLVINQALLTSAGRARAADLTKVASPREFWLQAEALAAGSRAPVTTIRLQSGAYEGMTVCLVELICAFGGDVGSDPGLTSTRNRRALFDLRQLIRDATFELPAEGLGDEEATVEAVQDNTVAVARLWPAQCHGLTAGPPRDEARPSEYLIIPVPGGVLGGQVAAIAAESPDSGAAEELAGFLAQPLSQLQLFSAAGYVPTLSPLYTVTSVRAELRSLGSQLDRASLRPSLRDYTAWSERFSQVVRAYLRHQSDDIALDVSQPLVRFS
jgi:ABC-type glycerol-3-phosphate transport system substrate-binding protein